MYTYIYTFIYIYLSIIAHTQAHLQYSGKVAVYSVLHCVAVRRSMLQCVAHYS